MSSGPGKPKDLHIRLNCTGVAKFLESGAVDWEGTLNAVMDDEIRLQGDDVPRSESECIEQLKADNAGLRAGMEQIRRIPEVLPISREIELLAVLKRFMDFQVSDYDRVADRAKDYCAIRRDARKVLQRYGYEADGEVKS